MAFRAIEERNTPRYRLHAGGNSGEYPLRPVRLSLAVEVVDEQHASMGIDPVDPVILAKRQGKLSALISAWLEPVVGLEMMHIGNTLNIVELGFGRKVHAPTRRDPERQISPHIFHCQCAVKINEKLVLGRAVEPLSAWLQGLEQPPVCSAMEVEESGELRLVLSQGHVVTVKPGPDPQEQHEHWRYFRPNDFSSHLVLFEED